MDAEVVDQIDVGGVLVQDVDVRLSEAEKNALLLAALPGAVVERYCGVRVVRYGDQIILKKQITHLGRPWPGFKKRIQIPKSWLDVAVQATSDGLTARFVGIYRYRDVTVFVDFEPATYLRRKANNSAAHVATNDLYQAQTLGSFTRTDRNGNRLVSVRADVFARYLEGLVATENPRVTVFRQFNEELLDGRTIEALDAVREMHAHSWPDRFQSEWAGFYLEYQFTSFVRSHALTDLVDFQKEKTKGKFDYDLVFPDGDRIEYYGDLKASNEAKRETPGNDAEDLRRCIATYGRFWYVVYEHTTEHAKDRGDHSVVAWNELRRDLGHKPTKGYGAMSYANKLKAAVTFTRMSILEVNEANFHLVLGEFTQGRQPDGAARAIKVMINKRNIDNFLIYSAAAAGL